MPSYRCTDEHGDYDRVIEAYNSQEAAQKWAKETYEAREYLEFDYCDVWNGNSNERFNVHVHLLPTFIATRPRK